MYCHDDTTGHQNKDQIKALLMPSIPLNNYQNITLGHKCSPTVCSNMRMPPVQMKVFKMKYVQQMPITNPDHKLLAEGTRHHF